MSGDGTSIGGDERWVLVQGLPEDAKGYNWFRRFMTEGFHFVGATFSNLRTDQARWAVVQMESCADARRLAKRLDGDTAHSPQGLRTQVLGAEEARRLEEKAAASKFTRDTPRVAASRNSGRNGRGGDHEGCRDPQPITQDRGQNSCSHDYEGHCDRQPIMRDRGRYSRIGDHDGYIDRQPIMRDRGRNSTGDNREGYRDRQTIMHDRGRNCHGDDREGYRDGQPMMQDRRHIGEWDRRRDREGDRDYHCERDHALDRSRDRYQVVVRDSDRQFDRDQRQDPDRGRGQNFHRDQFRDGDQNRNRYNNFRNGQDMEHKAGREQGRHQPLGQSCDRERRCWREQEQNRHTSAYDRDQFRDRESYRERDHNGFHPRDRDVIRDQR